MIKVSVIVPVYNVEKYIRECLNSLLKQTLSDIEIIVVNDGTKDRSIEIICDLIDSDERVRLVEQENGGLSAARNTGLKLARGKYISFVDSDDYVEPDFLKNLYEEGEKDNLDIVCGSHVRLYENGIMEEKVRSEELISNSYKSGAEILLKQLHYSDYRMEVWSNLYLKEFLDLNSLEFFEGIVHEDEEFTPRALIFSEKVKILNSFDYIYRKREASITSSITFKNVNSLSKALYNFLTVYGCLNQEKKIPMSEIIFHLVNKYIDKFMLIEPSYIKEFDRSLVNHAFRIVKENLKVSLSSRIKFLLLSIRPSLFYMIKKFK